MEILTAKDLSFTYAKSDKPALDRVSFSVSEGQFVTVCGPTGGGKSTLLRLIKKELTPKGVLTGELLYRGKPLPELSERQLDLILARFYAGKATPACEAGARSEKGGSPCA